MQDLSLYIHIPFCVQKCLYCDFLSFTRDNHVIEDYFKSLYEEIKRRKIHNDYFVKTIFIGGGTPTAVPSKYIIHLMNTIKDKFTLSDSIEITIESNPATFDLNKLREYRRAGINRLSIGLQCWQDRLLKSIGRIHTGKEFAESFLLAEEAGFNNINVDLIFALPDQTLEDWEETLKKVCSLDPTHLSCYSLKIEEGTPLYKWQEENKYEIDDKLDREMYYFAKEYLKSFGYEHYEISNFAKKDFLCKHNLVYWDLKPYIGFGLGAHSYFNNYRYNNEENINIYIENINAGKSILREKTYLSARHKKEEFVFLGLRKIQGVRDKDYEKKFGTSMLKDYKKEIDSLCKEGYIRIEGDNISLTDKGLDYGNYVFMKFLK